MRSSVDRGGNANRCRSACIDSQHFYGDYDADVCTGSLTAGPLLLLVWARGAGKTTWLRSVLPDSHRVDLLRDRELMRLLRDPGLVTREVEALRAGSWVVVDEVQKLPALLDEVQDLLLRERARR